MTKPYRYTSYHDRNKISDDLKQVLRWGIDQFGDCDTTSKALIDGGLTKSSEGVWGAKLKMLGCRRRFRRIGRKLNRNRNRRQSHYSTIKIRWTFQEEDDLAAFLFFSRITHINQGRQ